MLKMKSKKQFEIIIWLLVIPFILLIILNSVIPYADYFLFALVIFMVWILNQNAELVSGLSSDNPKIKTFKKMSIMALFIAFGMMCVDQYINTQELMNKKVIECYVVFGISIVMMIFGNYIPRIPFNKYLGYRLPWIVRDENIWRKTHKLFGFLAFPIAILQSIFIFFFPIRKVVEIGKLVWIITPGIYSLYLYFKKEREQVC